MNQAYWNLKEITHCKICGEVSYEVIQLILVTNHRPVEIRKCKSCEFTFLSHHLEDQGSLYGSAYWERDYKENKRFNRSQRKLKYQYYLRKIYPYLHEKKNPRVLDIGTGDALFLECLDKRFIKHCTEINDSSIHFLKSKNIDKIYIGEFETLQFNHEYDLIFASHVIEHIDNPRGFLRKAKSTLSKGGILALICPNEIDSIFSYIATIPGIRSYLNASNSLLEQDFTQTIPVTRPRVSIDNIDSYLTVALQHVNFYNPSTLRKSLNEHNFESIAMFNGRVNSTQSKLRNLIKNVAVDTIFYFFDMQEELFCICKK